MNAQSTAGKLPNASLLYTTFDSNSITQALEQNRYNKTATAKRLGLSLRALRYRIKKLGIE